MAISVRSGHMTRSWKGLESREEHHSYEAWWCVDYIQNHPHFRLRRNQPNRETTDGDQQLKAQKVRRFFNGVFAFLSCRFLFLCWSPLSGTDAACGIEKANWKAPHQTPTKEPWVGFNLQKNHFIKTQNQFRRFCCPNYVVFCLIVFFFRFVCPIFHMFGTKWLRV